MFGIGSTELLLILIVALLVLGPKSLASTARTVGKVMGQFRRVSTDFQRTLNAEVAMEEEKEKRDKAAKEVEADLQQPVANAGTNAAAGAVATAANPSNPAGQTASAAGTADSRTDAATSAGTTATASATAGATAAIKASAGDEDDDMLAPPPGSPLDEALKKAAAEAANAAELMEPVTMETAPPGQALQTAPTDQVATTQDAPMPSAQSQQASQYKA